MKYASVTTFNKNVTTFCSLAVLASGFVKLYNLVHSRTGLIPLVHFFGIVIDHLVGAVPGDGFGLAISATSFQKVDGVVSAQPRFICASADLPGTAASGDAITIDSTAYTVRVIQPEGTGIKTLVLEKN